MSKLCIIYNFAQLYRQPIFSIIDKKWDCEWWFAKSSSNIKGLDPSILKSVHIIKNKRLLGSMVWQIGIGSIIRRKDLNTFLMLGEPMTLSTWWILIQRFLFYRKKRIYLWSHGWYGREGFIKKWLKRFFFGMADHVFTYGEYAKNQAIKQGFKGEKITPIHNSLDHSKQIIIRKELKSSDIYRKHFRNDNPIILFIGRLTPVKRLDILLEAVALLVKKDINYNIVFIGDGEKRLELELKAEKLGIKDKVWFYGACYDDELNAQLIYDADLCVAPGNVGLTAMHSMVFGTPVLTHDDFIWQMPEFEAIIPEKTGAFFRKNDISSLANEIQRWFNRHNDDREYVRKACYNEIDTNWTPEYQINILETIIPK